MPYGPNGQWRPADPGACARLVCDIATSESPEVYARPAADAAAIKHARQGGEARTQKLTAEQRSRIAASGGKARAARRRSTAQRKP